MINLQIILKKFSNSEPLKSDKLCTVFRDIRSVSFCVATFCSHFSQSRLHEANLPGFVTVKFSCFLLTLKTKSVFGVNKQ